MSVYSTSFGEYTTDAAPSDWTSRWGTTGEAWTVRADSGSTAGKYLEHTRTTTLKRLLSWNDIDADSGRDNAEILVRFKSTAATSAGAVYLVLRGSGSDGAETGYIFYNSTTNTLRIARIVAGTITNLTSLSFTFSSNVYYHIRFRVNASALKAKIWAGEHEQEPAAWSSETTDINITGTGWVGVGSAASSGTRFYDDVAIGTSGDTAAFPVADAANVTQEAGLVLAAFNAATQLTQLAALVMVGAGVPARVTQGALLVVYEPLAAMRATTYQALILAEFHADTPVTQIAALVLVDHVPCLTRWAQCWTITRTDGEVFAFTSLDRPLSFRGVAHQPCASLAASAAEQSTALGTVGNQELLGIISDVGISERAVINGLFDFARVECWLVPWDNTTGQTPSRIMAGTLGGVSQTTTGFKFEVLTDAAELRQRALLETFTPGCRYGFGSVNDSRCPVDLAALTVSGSVTSTAVPAAWNQATRRIVIDSSRAEADGYFDLGVLTFDTGNNAGASSEIKSFAGGVFVLWSPMLYPIEATDTYSASPGCNKSPAAHLVFNADMLDFGGFPDVPGNDSINQAPDAKG